MSYLLRGSTTFTTMGWVDKVPRAGKLYIGGLYGLYQTDLIAAAGVTHVLSVIDYDPLLQEKFAHLTHLHIRADDHPNENLLQYFPEAVHYIDHALNETTRKSEDEKAKGQDEGQEDRGGVFVHCAMGKSRSATLIVAYLMWKYHLDPATALEQLCEGRPVCDPNPGFKEQLQVWERMCKSDKEEGKMTIYNRWKQTRFTGEYWEWDRRGPGFKANL
ncbi:phosphatases II [Dothidotthia symphoricarpi CBS 119687]|uniref:protein-tyrosine-phosphatase n=1 Tax=Dothidotthia symphoricarpi CBS 119687 TaxID=1392245 RepID=A0A6A6A062_9PLEO|nr:phosphatases II [Dothidotthia symphoricarpi CBS 119687]KAF2124347.1 phosphatases II [Dothidotthia symphoricarpi CBS 119687]